MCPPGTYRRSPVQGMPGDKYQVCDTCDYGKYQDEFGQDECKQCGPGQYQDQSKNDASKVGDVEKVDMTTSFMDASNAVSVESGRKCRTCKAGTVPSGPDSEWPGRYCVNCPMGKQYAGDPALPCKSCERGKYQDIPAEKTGGPKSSISVKCKSCSKGKSPVDSTSECTKCAAGRIQENSTSDVWGCKTCQEGTQFLSSTVECQACPTGRYQDRNNVDGVQCKTCGKGTDAPDAKSPCLHCAPGKYQHLAESVTYGCRALEANACGSNSGGSQGDGEGPGRVVVIKMFNGRCCSGSPLTTVNFPVFDCMLSETGTEMVSLFLGGVSFSFFYFFFPSVLSLTTKTGILQLNHYHHHSLQHTCSKDPETGEMMHHVKAWKQKTCTNSPFFEERNASNKCINLRDGHSVYYDCNNAHLSAELSSGAKLYAAAIKWVAVSVILVLTHV